jgi:uncharacterized protein (TIGR02145 family)
MRYFPKHIIIFIALLSGAIIFSCKKETISLPIVSTKEVWNIFCRSATAGGEVSFRGGASITARGVCWSKSSGPTISNNHTTESGDIGSFVSTLNGLTPGTLYYVRAYATNKGGTAYGNEVTFGSSDYDKPEITTNPISFINSTSAVSGGIIYLFCELSENISSKGVCWSTNIEPTLENPHTTDGTGPEQFISRLEGLSSSTIYYVRAYATNEAGTAYGNELTFKTLSDSEAIIFHPIIFNPNLTYGTVRDAEWNVYKTIQIGTQTWMAENLKTTIFNNLGQIANGNDHLGGDNDNSWENRTYDLYCWYNSDTANKRNNGALYNWYAVKTGMLCPEGWHVPTLTEFSTLITFLGGEGAAGGKLKETGTTHWLSPNSGATNESGFSALPGGYRSYIESLSIDTAGYWWCSTESNAGSASFIILKNDSDSASINSGYQTNGMSVRCIKD